MLDETDRKNRKNRRYSLSRNIYIESREELKFSEKIRKELKMSSKMRS